MATAEENVKMPVTSAAAPRTSTGSPSHTTPKKGSDGTPKAGNTPERAVSPAGSMTYNPPLPTPIHVHSGNIQSFAQSELDGTKFLVATGLAIRAPSGADAILRPKSPAERIEYAKMEMAKYQKIIEDARDQITKDCGQDLKWSISDHLEIAGIPKTRVIQPATGRMVTFNETSDPVDEKATVTSKGHVGGCNDTAKHADMPVAGSVDFCAAQAIEHAYKTAVDPDETPAESTKDGKTKSGNRSLNIDYETQIKAESDAGSSNTDSTDNGFCIVRPANVSPEASPVVKPVNGKQEEVTSYHEDADLYIKVRKGGNAIMYKVHSALIGAASPVWSKVNYSGKYKRPSTGKFVIEMMGPDDDAFGLDIIFSIIHYHFHDIPDRPTIAQLYGIARVAEKYRCQQLLVPFAKDWMTSLNNNIVLNDLKSPNDVDKCLFISWVFGEGRWFLRLISRVAFKVTLDDAEGHLLDASGKPWKEYNVPQGLIKVIQATRAKAVKEILTSVSEPYAELMNNVGDTRKFCRCNDATDEAKQNCVFLQLGSLMQGLRGADMAPLPDPENYHGSVENLASKLKALKVAHYKTPGTAPHQDAHGNCGIRHQQVIIDVMNGTIELTGNVIQALRERAKKSGAYTDTLFYEMKDMEERNPSAEPDENLCEDAAHYKQIENFGIAKDYYSESYPAVAIKVEDFDA